MNYQKNIRIGAMKRRTIMLICIVAFLGFIIGGVLGCFLRMRLVTGEGKGIGQAGMETLVYGTYDERCFAEEISINWRAGDLDFKPVDCQMPEEQQEFVYYLCSGYNIDFTLVMALIQRESRYDPNAVGSMGDYGYMQINAQNHEWLTEVLGVTDYLEPYQNIRAGVFVLRKLFERYQDVGMVLMAYNMGESGAKRLWKEGIFETGYTQGVLEIQKQICEQLGE